MVVVLVLSLQHGVTPPHAGAPLGSPADTDPTNSYSAARPEWFLVGVYEFSHLFPGQWGIVPIFIVPGVLVCILLLMPFAARYLLGHMVNVAFTAVVLIAVIAMSWISLAKDRASPTYRHAVVTEELQAARVCVLAVHQGIPATGALTLLHNDPKTQGPRLFAQHCASCHSHAADDAGDGEIIEAEKPAAPNLAGFASRAWIAGLLDPKQIGGPAYFGNTKLRTGKMPGFVKDTLAGLDENGQKDVQRVVKALSAEAQLPSQRELDANDAKEIEQGRKLLVEEFSCTDCHRFHDKGPVGNAPNLTGYGSPEWSGGILRNPADKHYYGKLNDRMPAYAASPTDPAQNILSTREIKMLSNWLRGEWYEEGRDQRLGTAFWVSILTTGH
jgi:ubiquinol-cytochrome c reductase cytochrome b subunit